MRLRQGSHSAAKDNSVLNEDTGEPDNIYNQLSPNAAETFYPTAF